MKTTFRLAALGVTAMCAFLSLPASAQFQRAIRDPALMWGEVLSPMGQADGTFEVYEYPQSRVPSFPYRFRVYHRDGDVEDVIPMMRRASGILFTFTRYSVPTSVYDSPLTMWTEERSGLFELREQTARGDEVEVVWQTTSAGAQNTWRRRIEPPEVYRATFAFRGRGLAPAFDDGGWIGGDRSEVDSTLPGYLPASPDVGESGYGTPGSGSPGDVSYDAPPAGSYDGEYESEAGEERRVYPD